MIKKIILSLFILLLPQLSQAFCGFYVAKADASLYNHASQVIIAHQDNKTVLSLMNDYQGELIDFALVIPVPEVLQAGQIHIGDEKLFKRIDDFTAPRLVEYHDESPCQAPALRAMADFAAAPLPSLGNTLEKSKSLGVTVEAEYTIGEYDIVILSAKESKGLETWLLQNGYHLPQGANRALKPYILQQMKFFVAKVNLKEQQKTGLHFLRPLQFAFESKKFMLPLRLGMINANGVQDLLIYLLTEQGRVEVTNYQTIKLPTNIDLPVFIQSNFAKFYQALFDFQANQQHLSAVFTEYFWNMGWCDPCATTPLTPNELKQLGVFWLKEYTDFSRGLPVQVTRLHLRYTNESFPEDLTFQETGDTESFQTRYILRHAWQGSPKQCPAAIQYFKELAVRHEIEAKTLADLTGWDIRDIHQQMNSNQDIQSPNGEITPVNKAKQLLNQRIQSPWWKGIW